MRQLPEPGKGGRRIWFLKFSAIAPAEIFKEGRGVAVPLTELC
jgi:hypothetical protein